MSSSIFSSDTLSSGGARFLCGYAVCLAAGIGLVSGWNLLVDPYDMYHGWTRHGFNHFKSHTAGQYDRMSKARHIARRRPDAIILGTSRADWGLDPSHPGLQAVSPDYYNASLAGATMYELLRYMQHAHAVNPLKQVILGIDLEMFNTRKTRYSFSEHRLAVTAEGDPNWRQRAADSVATLFSQDALEANHDTRHLSRKHKDVTRAELLDPGSAYYETRDPEEAWKIYQLGVRQARLNLGQLESDLRLYMEQAGYLNEFLAFAHRERIELIMYITPYHVSHLETLRTTGQWTVFEYWKRDLAARNATIAKEWDRDPFPLWDFSGYHRFATEPHPTDDDPNHVMTWYRESSHFRKITGDMILDVITGRAMPETGFGRRLTVETVEAVWAEDRAQRDAYLEESDPDE